MALSEVHTEQRLMVVAEAQKRKPSLVFQWLSLLSGLAISILAGLGIVMTFRAARRKWVPVLLIFLGGA